MRGFSQFILFFLFPIDSICSELNHSQHELIPTLEVLCIVDFDTYIIHKKNEENLRNYFFSFWKTVDHDFQLGGKFKVHVNLTDILIERTRDELDFVRLNRVSTYYKESPSNILYVYNLMESMGLYFYSHKRELPRHDVAIFITQSRLCSEYTKSLEECEAFVPFVTSTGQACSVDHEKKKVGSVGVIRDEGKYYRGIRRAVVTIGSLLGAELDGSLGSESCKSTDGYMMSPIVHFNYQYKFNWSDCSINMMRKFLDPLSPRAACLFKQPNNKSIDLSSVPLPGQIFELDTFCSHLLGYEYTARNHDEKVCSRLVCWDTQNKWFTPLEGPALEGSWCNKNKRCLYGKCVPFPYFAN